MTDRRVNDLSYGQLGQAYYDLKNDQWLFNHLPSNDIYLQPLGRSEISISPTNDSSFNIPGRGDSSAREQHKRSRALVKSNPELVPALEHLPILARASTIISSHVAQHDGAKSTLYAIGKARDIDNQRSGARTVPVLALVSGSAGESLRLIQGHSRKRTWGKLRGISLEVPGFGGQEECTWFGDYSPICQVCYSEYEGGGGTWLCVRLQTSTVVMRPKLHRAPVPVSDFEKGGLNGKSRLNPNVVLNVPIRSTGGKPHADVSFNPWYQHQIAIVDQAGRWSIWDITETKIQKLKEPLPSATGFIKENPTSLDHADGWARICWSGSVNMLVVSNRRTLAIFSLSSRVPVRLETPDLGIAKTTSWILDLKRSPIDPSHLFVLTSTHIVWLEVTSHTLPRATNESQDPGAKVLLSWRHFRDGEDVTLRLECLPVQDVLYVSLYSSLTTFATVFQFSKPEGSLIPLSTADPFPLRFSPGMFDSGAEGDLSSGVNHSQIISCLKFFPLQYSTDSRFEVSPISRQYMDLGIVFIRMLLLRSDLSLWTCDLATYNSWDNHSIRGRPLLKNVTLPNRDVPLSAPAKTSTRVYGEAFLTDGEDEEDVSEIEDIVHVVGKRPKELSRTGTAGNMSDIDSVYDPRTLDFSWVFDVAFRKGPESKTSEPQPHEEEDSPEVGGWLARLRGTLAGKLETGYRPLETLSEIAPKPSHNPDVDSLSTEIEEFLQRIGDVEEGGGPAFDLTHGQLISPGFLGFSAPATDKASASQTGSMSFAQIYDHLVAVWIFPLPRNLPGKVRMAMERKIRSIALTIYLSSMAVSLQPQEAPEMTVSRAGSPTEQEEPQFALAVRSKPSTAYTSPQRSASQPPIPQASSPQLPESSDPVPYSSPHILPAQLPSPTPTPSLYSQSTTTTGGASKDQESSASARLRAYTHIAPQPQLPTNLSTVLDHWTLGADPKEYSYTATSRALNPPLSDLSDVGDDAESVKSGSQSRRKRMLKKREKKRANDSRTLLASSQPGVEGLGDGRAWGSQPAPRLGPVIESSQVSGAIRGSGSGMPESMSQVERGAFGGRLAEKERKRKKRKRAAGF
ncbi:MAG: hypothetical protein M4579_005149 [Chaenotheca gracillima]|nr:MAG: hypothetical protein M4579_005149 [Chaenotheca gracillima]